MQAKIMIEQKMIRRIPVVVLIVGLIVSGCESLHLYEGDKRPREQLALITGDSRLSGSLPIRAVIRRVDEEDLGMRFQGVYVLPGDHDLLIDCTVTESKSTSRHHLRVDVDAGVKYRLVANTGPGNRSCNEVELVGRY
jgi:hypothetical protein